MKIKALILDVDGTLADTEEAHRCAFNRAFEQHKLAWHWSADEYVRLLKITGGKERIGAYVDSLPIDAAERGELHAQIPAIHATKTENYTQLVREGLVPFREGVTLLLDEAERAGVSVSIATTTSFSNIEALLQVNLGRDALANFSVIGAAEQARRKKTGARRLRVCTQGIARMRGGLRCHRGFGQRFGGRQGRRTIYGYHPEPVDARREF